MSQFDPDSDKKTVYVAYSNTDRTEGRGVEFPFAVCQIESTAVRLAHKAHVQGTDGPVKEWTLKKFDGVWWAPALIIQIHQPTVADLSKQAIMDAKRAAIARAKAAGLTDQEIALLGGAS